MDQGKVFQLNRKCNNFSLQTGEIIAMLFICYLQLFIILVLVRIQNIAM